MTQINIIYTVSFIYGIIFKLLDEMYDSNILTEYKEITEFIVLVLTVYLILCNKYISFAYSTIFIILYYALSSESTEDFVWKAIFFISIVSFIYHLLYNFSDIKLLMYSAFLPIFISGGIMGVIDDRIFPENFSNRKYIERCFFSFLCLATVLVLNFTILGTYLPDMSRSVWTAIELLTFGYFSCSVLCYSIFPY